MKKKLELNRQRRIIEAVERQGGFGYKMSHRMKAGVLDLYLTLPGFAPCIVEVKDLGEVHDAFIRKIDTTELQEKMIENVNTVNEQYGLTAFCITAYKIKGCFWLAATPNGEERLTHQEWRSTGGLRKHQYDIVKLFKAMGVPKLYRKGRESNGSAIIR